MDAGANNRAAHARHLRRKGGDHYGHADRKFCFLSLLAALRTSDDTPLPRFNVRAAMLRASVLGEAIQRGLHGSLEEHQPHARFFHGFVQAVREAPRRKEGQEGRRWQEEEEMRGQYLVRIPNVHA